MTLNAPQPATHPGFVSVFDRSFDVVVCGAGFTGFAAARVFARRGFSTLLLEPSGDVLWESGRAFENSAIAPREACTEWSAWLEELHEHGGTDDRFFDAALAEIVTCRDLASRTPGAPEILLYAAPVALETADGRLAAVVVATKSGPRRLVARHWFDATERGDLARLAKSELAPRPAAKLERNLLLHTVVPGSLDDVLDQVARRRGDFTWTNSVRAGERRIRLLAGDAYPVWHTRVPGLVSELREAAGVPANFVFSLCASREFPTYAEAAGGDLSGLPANLVVASPGLRGEALATPADRFALGVKLAESAATRLGAPTAGENVVRASSAEVSLPAPRRTLSAVDVLVAGAGTGGAIAALSAARSGARVRAIDFISWPGGVGSASGICGYFHGAKGGLQTEIDERAQRLTAIFAGGSPAGYGWHHEAKRIALHAAFDEAGVEFVGEVMLAGVERDADGRVTAALAVIDGELVRLPAATFVDGTGDGDLAVFAGASAFQGRPGDSRTLAYSQAIFWITEKDGRLHTRSCNFDAGWVDPTDAEDFTRARLTGIAQHFQTPWTGPGRAVTLAPWIGLRQSRQIETDYVLTFSDLLDHARFADSLGMTETVADTHSVDFEFETDEMAFYYWTCRAFRHHLRCELPYRMILPRGLDNVWLACRAAGIAVDAAYGVRMQRDVQRLGEAAGLAAAQAARRGVGARAIDLALLQDALFLSGAKAPADAEETPDEAEETDLLAALDRGLPGFHLWKLVRARDSHEGAVRERLHSADTRVSFYAAAVLAMWNDASAEERLVTAIDKREIGPTPEEKIVHGAFGQCIDLPFWMQAVVLLRRVGSAHCLPVLRALAGTRDLPLNVRTTIALSVERIAERLGANGELVQILEALTATPVPDPVLPPSRSLWLTLQGEPQKKLPNDRGAPTAQDHTWQLHLVTARTRHRLGLPLTAAEQALANDSRAHVRTVFHKATRVF